eukprot:1148014-Pelagomonas_calceolata.AAC.2
MSWHGHEGVAAVAPAAAAAAAAVFKLLLFWLSDNPRGWRLAWMLPFQLASCKAWRAGTCLSSRLRGAAAAAAAAATVILFGAVMVVA